MMKKLFYTLVAVLFVSQFSYAQRGQGQQRQRMTPEQRVERMAEQLNLSDDQKAKILEIDTSFGDKTADLRSQIRDADEEDRMDLVASMRAIMKERDEKVKEVLNPEQQEKYDEILKKREEMREQRMAKRSANKRGGAVRPGK